jgi:hypothetical protein
MSSYRYDTIIWVGMLTVFTKPEISISTGPVAAFFLALIYREEIVNPRSL